MSSFDVFGVAIQTYMVSAHEAHPSVVVTRKLLTKVVETNAIVVDRKFDMNRRLAAFARHFQAHSSFSSVR